MSDILLSEWSTPLLEGQIRLVDFGAHNNQPAVVRAFLSDRPEYFALSYCWGEQSESLMTEFEINHQSLRLGPSLYAAFQQFKAREYQGRVWVDAICINQNDDAEKSVQIPLMSTIYTQAKEVIAWLGEAADSFDPAATHLHALCELWDGLGKVERDVPFESLVRRFPDKLPAYGSSEWDLLDDVLRSPWLTRLWTYPEAVLAATLTFWYGRITLTAGRLGELGEILDKTAYFALKMNSRKPAPFHGHLRLRMLITVLKSRAHVRDHGQLEWPTLILAAEIRDVTQPQDKVYAILSLMSPLVRSWLSVDYTVPSQVVLKRVTQLVFKFAARPLDLIPFAMGTGNAFRSPSWVLDFSRLPSQSFPPKDLTGYSKKSQLYVGMNDDDDRLQLCGYGLDKVKQVVPSPIDLRMESVNLENIEPLCKEPLTSWIENCKALAKEIDESAYLLHLARTLTCSSAADVANASVYRRPSDDDLDVQGLNALLTSPDKVLEHGFALGLASKHASKILRYSFRHSFFTTTGSRMGLGPSDLQPSDRIVAFHGAPYLSAIRKIESTNEWRLVGVCFVSGLECGDGPKSGSTETFTLV